MYKYGCVGKKLSHSFSKDIHGKLANYEYELIELNEEEVIDFFKKKEFKAVNVTIPYKQTVIPFLDYESDVAKRIGAVNTVVNKNGKLYGYNTDYYGMKALIEKNEFQLSGKKVLILGTGGTAQTARAVTMDLGAEEVIFVSRNKFNENITYEEATKYHVDANFIINTTPVGMYPDFDACPIDVSAFNKLEGVIDAVYNPLSTKLVLDARKKGVKAEGGLYMLVMQAVVAAEKFIDTEIERSVAKNIYASILKVKENIVLSGMPGSGKSTVGKLIGLDGFEFFDTDTEIEKLCGCSVKEFIETKGEKCFRDLETEVIARLAAEGSRVISTGGGAVLREQNVRLLKQNGKIYFLNADLSRLNATKDRPLSNTNEKLVKLYNERIEIYKSTADIIVPDLGSPEDEADFILKKRMEQI